MSNPYPPQPRRLMRDPSNKLIGGVCSGLAKYLNMDVNLVRILTVVISLFTGIPIVLYLIALFVLPEERNTPPQPPYVSGPQPDAFGGGYTGQPYQQQSYQQPTHGAPAQPQPASDDVWGPGGAPWEQAPAPGTASPVPAPEQQTWQQPPSWQSSPQPASEPTAYDTTPVENPTDGAPDEAPATAAPEAAPVDAPDPEAAPEADAPQPAPEQTSTWESAPAEPESSEPEVSESERGEGAGDNKPQA